MAEKNFLLISNMYPNAENPGFGSFVKNVCEGMRPYGLLMQDKAVIRGRGRTTLQKISKYIGFYTSICRRFFKRHDFVYIHFPNQAVPLLSLLYLFKRPTTVVNYHGEDLIYSKSGLGNLLGRLTENFCRRHASRVVVPSQYFKEIVTERGIVPEENIIISPSGGIDPDVFHTTGKRVFLNDGILRLGCVGRLEPGKGVLEFLQTCRLLTEKKITYKATVVGYGSLLDDVRGFIETHNLTEAITLINGMPQKDLGDCYRNLDLLIFMSSREAESLGLTGIEAMACGTPVIGSDAGGIRSYLRDGENGYIIPSRTPEDTVAAIERFIRLSEKDRLAMSHSCADTGQRYSAPEVCRNLALSFIASDTV